MAQEVIKACTHMSTPLNKFFYMDTFECSDENADLQPMNSRYDNQVTVLGREMQRKIKECSPFVVGGGCHRL
jgi:hypothetical protein